MILVIPLIIIPITGMSEKYLETKENRVENNQKTAHPNLIPPTRKITEQTNHTPITIIGNANFTSANGVIGGAGTEQDPYLIANWVIDGNGSNHCIQLVNTTAYFRIENCQLWNATAGGMLDNVTNGLLQQNICHTNSYGIHLAASSFSCCFSAPIT